MVPPEPLELALAALPGLGAEEELIVLVYCLPHPLFSALREAGFVWREEIEDDGTHRVSIRRPAVSL